MAPRKETKIAASGTRITRSSATRKEMKAVAAGKKLAPAARITRSCAAAAEAEANTTSNPDPNSTAATRKKKKVAPAEPVTAEAASLSEDDLEAAVAAGVAALVQEDLDDIFTSPRVKSAEEAQAIADKAFNTPAYLAVKQSYARIVRANLSPSRKSEIVVKSAYTVFFGVEDTTDDRHFARVKYSSTLTIGELKAILKPYPWIPKKMLVLIKEGSTTPLCVADDNATLAACGIKAMDTILACMDGGFKFIIYDVNTDPFNWKVSMRSCCQSIGDLKAKISKLRGYRLEDLVITRSSGSPPLEDKTLLVTVGVVKPYTKDMGTGYHVLRLKKIHGLRRQRQLAAAAVDIAAA